MSLKHKLVTSVATGALGLGLALGGSAATAAPAEAASWLPSKSKVKQPVGWGNTCALVTKRNLFRSNSTIEYRWWTTSIGLQSCSPYRVY